MFQAGSRGLIHPLTATAAFLQHSARTLLEAAVNAGTVTTVWVLESRYGLTGRARPGGGRVNAL